MKVGRSVTARAASTAAANAGDVGLAGGQRLDELGVPAVGGVPGDRVLAEGDGGVVLDRDVVVVPDDGEVAQSLGAGQRGRLAGDALLDVPVGGEDVDVVVERARPRGGVGVEQAALAPGGHRHPDRRGQALPERAGGGLHALGVPVLGVAGGQRAPGPERLEVGQLEPVPGQVQLDVQRQARVPAGQDEPVATDPVLVGRVVPQHVLEEVVGERGQAHRGARVAVADLLDRVHRQPADDGHGAVVQIGPAGRSCAARAHGVPAFSRAGRHRTRSAPQASRRPPAEPTDTMLAPAPERIRCLPRPGRCA